MPRIVRKRLLKCVTDTVALPVRHHERNSQAFCQEVVIWKHLTHPNILPLLGTTIAPLQLISHWMPGGDLPEYIKKNSDADRLGLVGAPLSCSSHAYFRCQLSDITKGLCYLHSCNVIHGDLKGVSCCSESYLATPSHVASRTSSSTIPVMHASRISASLRSPKTWIPSGALRLSMGTPRGGLRQRSWARGHIARKRTFSLSRWS
jgi:serine/threonine protein kinase